MPVPVSTLVPTLLGGTLAAAASMLGVALVHFQPIRTRTHALSIAALAAGVILGASFLHLLPDAIERAGGGVMGWALAAFFALYVLETHAVRHEHHDGEENGHGHGGHGFQAAALHAAVPAEAHRAHVHAPEGVAPLASIALAAFALHSAFDGLALGVGFTPGIELRTQATLGVLAHKIPEGIALGALLLRTGAPPARALAQAAIIALLTPVVATIAHLTMGDGFSPAAMGRMLALVAGSFVYVASADLLPEVAHHPRIGRTALILVGVALTAVVGLVE